MTASILRYIEGSEIQILNCIWKLEFVVGSCLYTFQISDCSNCLYMEEVVVGSDCLYMEEVVVVVGSLLIYLQNDSTMLMLNIDNVCL